MENNPIFKIFESFPRQGPGDDEHTEKAFSIIAEPPEGGGEILDVGCGKGVQTMVLARLCPDCRITATDIHRPFLDAVDEKATSGGFSDRVKTVHASMDDLPFEEESFDIIWAEGCSFIMGFGNAVRYWKKFLKPGGYMMISDLFWFTESPSAEAREFFAEIDPTLMIEEKGFEIIRNVGLEQVGFFRLPPRVWEESYYSKVEEKLGNLMEEFKDDEVALKVIEGLKKEIEIFKKYSDEYGYTYNVMRKPF